MKAVHERIEAVLSALGVQRAHFAAGLASELVPLMTSRPQIVDSLTLVNPNRLEVEVLGALSDRLAIVTGVGGLPAKTVDDALPALVDARVVRVEDYFTAAWSDFAADNPQAVIGTLSQQAEARSLESLSIGEQTGEVDGISYRVSGSGPALVLLPLLLAPSQWEPLVAQLGERFQVIVLGGPHLGMVAMLESRGSEPGYQRVIRNVVDAISPVAGETIVEIGCGTGVLARFIAELTRGENPIVATDLNDYFLSEARALAAKHRFGTCLDFQSANAEALPFEDNSVDVAFSSTVMEECDADKMLAEMIRVTRPGGRVGVVVRGTDMHSVVSMPLTDALKAKVEAPYRSVAERGCADATLYDRFSRSPLESCEFFPGLLTLRDPQGAAWAYREPFLLSLLNAAEVTEWHERMAEATAAGTFVFSSGLHCAVGRKPLE
ncbi:MAG: methyltransferase domain-containing protein [Gammaproteobacteria bacterium]|nr:methyltransferase domain-containing protein [Gammaproteobacteria bacterium]